MRPSRLPKSYRVQDRLSAASRVSWMPGTRLPKASTCSPSSRVSEPVAETLGSQALSALPSAAACPRAAAQVERVDGLRHSARSTATGNVTGPTGSGQSRPRGSVSPGVRWRSAESVPSTSGWNVSERGSATAETHAAALTSEAIITSPTTRRRRMGVVCMAVMCAACLEQIPGAFVILRGIS